MLRCSESQVEERQENGTALQPVCEVLCLGSAELASQSPVVARTARQVTGLETEKRTRESIVPR